MPLFPPPHSHALQFRPRSHPPPLFFWGGGSRGLEDVFSASSLSRLFVATGKKEKERGRRRRRRRRRRNKAQVPFHSVRIGASEGGRVPFGMCGPWRRGIEKPSFVRLGQDSPTSTVVTHRIYFRISPCGPVGFMHPFGSVPSRWTAMNPVLSVLWTAMNPVLSVLYGTAPPSSHHSHHDVC